MESKELYRHLLGINEPWAVERVDLDMAKDELMCLSGMPKACAFPVRNAGRHMPCTTMRLGAPGGIWIVASS